MRRYSLVLVAALLSACSSPERTGGAPAGLGGSGGGGAGTGGSGGSSSASTSSSGGGSAPVDAGPTCCPTPADGGAPWCCYPGGPTFHQCGDVGHTTVSCAFGG